MTITKCAYGGGNACKRQGGDGCTHHGSAYTHPFPGLPELEKPIEDTTTPMNKSEMIVKLPTLETFFDEDLSKAVLELPIEQVFNVTEYIRKSLYDFDLDTPEGITKILEVLPIMDPEIVRDLCGRIWLGYQAKEADPELLKAEIRGYLSEYLEEIGFEPKEEMQEAQTEV